MPTTSATDLLEIILRECARLAPEPLYPGAYVQGTGVARTSLDDALDQLRLGGLIRLTDWTQGRGQGYTVTPSGSAVLQSSRLLERLRTHGTTPRPVPVLEAVPESRARTSTWTRGEAVRSVLVDSPRPLVTHLLILVNLLVFFAGMYRAAQFQEVPDYLGMKQDSAIVREIRHDTGALSARDLVVEKQWWRLIAYMFVHIGAMHLLMNMMVLHFMGPIVEQMWGPVRYLGLYLIAGVGAAVAQLLIDPQSGLAGASGSLCGLLGSMAVWVTLNRAYLPPRHAADWMRNIVINIVFIAMISFLPEVSWAGHLGGGIVGAIVAVPLLYQRFGSGLLRWLALVAVLLVPVLCVLVMYARLFSAPAQERDTRMKQDRDARIKLLEGMMQKDVWAAQLEDEHVRSVLRKIPSDRWDDPDQVIVSAVVRARDDFRGFAQELDAAGQGDVAMIDTGIKVAQAYLESQVRCYDLLVRCMTDNKSWTGADEDALKLQLQDVNRRRATWRDSPFLPRRVALKR
jgi:membrane associated rhomboid family serine protease